MYFLYTRKNPKNHLYIGVSSNLQERIKRHNQGDGAEFTKRNKAFELVYKENS
jgi:putative endonuclease